jgi:asparagine synthase (glutamine-hydrolysing)
MCEGGSKFMLAGKGIGRMCGVFGAVGCQVSSESLDAVLDVLKHRGPDGNGTFVDEAAGVTFGHTRLKVIDLETGAQPLESEDGNIVLVANGEIYDFERIRASLEAKGHRFRTRSDSEVIIYLYREYGFDCLEHLRGEFVFLLYDRVEQLLIAARDRFGIKPLYLSRLADGYVFASEIKAIFASGLVAPKLDVAALDPIFNQDPQKMRFPFEGIEHLPPASYMAIDLETGESKLAHYWSPEIPGKVAEPVPEPFGDAPDVAAQAVLRELDEAVLLRLRADVPVGLYLSGGLDSTFIGALMKRSRGTSFHSFSISFVGSDKNEEEFTRRASKFLGTDHHELRVTKEMLWKNLEDCLWHTELPFVSLAPVGKFLLSEEAKKRVTVVLNGQGADEVFLGYRAFFQNAIRDTRSGLGERASSVRARRLKVEGVSERMLEKLSLLLFHKSHRRQLEAARAQAATPVDTSRPLVNIVQETRIAEMPVDILGFLGDRVEMAHSLEVRVPFLDHKLYDLAKWIPDDFKMRQGTEKAVLRDAAKGLLPEDLRLRRKQGFMFTSDPIDFFGADRQQTEALRAKYLSRDAFDRSRAFSYGAYRVISALAKLPKSNRVPALKRLRKTANKLMMYMMQTHMLHDMYIASPRWAKPKEPRGRGQGKVRELVA